jgi:hypothetical protein
MSVVCYAPCHEYMQWRTVVYDDCDEFKSIDQNELTIFVVLFMHECSLDYFFWKMQMPPVTQTIQVSSRTFQAAVPKGCSHGHSWYNLSDGCFPSDAWQRLEFFAEEICFMAHSLVDVVPVFGMVDKLCCLFHCKGDAPCFIGVGSKVDTIL